MAITCLVDDGTKIESTKQFLTALPTLKKKYVYGKVLLLLPYLQLEGQLSLKLSDSMRMISALDVSPHACGRFRVQELRHSIWFRIQSEFCTCSYPLQRLNKYVSGMHGRGDDRKGSLPPCRGPISTFPQPPSQE